MRFNGKEPTDPIADFADWLSASCDFVIVSKYENGKYLAEEKTGGVEKFLQSESQKLFDKVLARVLEGKADDQEIGIEEAKDLIKSFLIESAEYLST